MANVLGSTDVQLGVMANAAELGSDELSVRTTTSCTSSSFKFITKKVLVTACGFSATRLSAWGTTCETVSVGAGVGTEVGASGDSVSSTRVLSSVSLHTRYHGHVPDGGSWAVLGISPKLTQSTSPSRSYWAAVEGSSVSKNQECAHSPLPSQSGS